MVLAPMTDFLRLGRLMSAQANVEISVDLLRSSLLKCWSLDDSSPLWMELIGEVERINERAAGRMEAAINAEWEGN